MNDDDALFTYACIPPWLVVRFPSAQRIVSWSVNRPGFVRADTVAWLQVRNADLPIDVDPRHYFAGRLAECGLAEAVGLMTARDIRHHQYDAALPGVASLRFGSEGPATGDEDGFPVDVVVGVARSCLLSGAGDTSDFAYNGRRIRVTTTASPWVTSTARRRR